MQWGKSTTNRTSCAASNTSRRNEWPSGSAQTPVLPAVRNLPELKAKVELPPGHFINFLLTIFTSALEVLLIILMNHTNADWVAVTINYYTHNILCANDHQATATAAATSQAKKDGINSQLDRLPGNAKYSHRTLERSAIEVVLKRVYLINSDHLLFICNN